MPKKKHFVNIKFVEKDVSYPCQICGYYTKSITAMKLHRKSRHGITEKYDKDDNWVFTSCRGCGKEKATKCNCDK